MLRFSFQTGTDGTSGVNSSMPSPTDIKMPFDSLMYDANSVYRSWTDNQLRFVAQDEANAKPGFRKPQIAALHIALAHLISSPSTPATIVMPTGTGKTDTIFALLVAGCFTRTVIIVPSDALRDQTAEKLKGLKNLRSMTVVNEAFEDPEVAKISTRLSEEEIAMLETKNVLIATPQALQNFSTKELERFVSICSHLIVDEAHHVAANTWANIKKEFAGKPTIQFTATPFREDKGSLDGRIIYNYPLRDAQRDGYFQSIEFHPIREYQPSLADQAIADKAVELLRADLSNGNDHLLMVRAKSKKRAEILFQIYSLHESLCPVLIHSEIKGKTQVLEAIKAKKHRIIICVDMLGEGFDLPELKLAAIHDQHQSPAVTLQFIGRLTRSSTKLGTAKFIANIANQRMDAQMAALYAESADWSAIIRDVSSDKIQREVDREKFAAEFDENEGGKAILSLNPEPKISAIAYNLSATDWMPKNVDSFSSKREKLQFLSINEDGDLVLMVTKAHVSVPWARTSEIRNTEWFLYLAWYEKTSKTLFVHCSGDEAQASKFRDLIAKSAQRIAGEKTFRTLHGLSLIKLQNVGLSRTQKDVRFTMHVGRDINSVMGDLENGTSLKSNIFATGYAGGKRANVGCSHKGKIWEMNSGPIDQWRDWCATASVKLNDPSIETNDILNNVMRSEQVKESWPSGLFFADWPESILIDTEINIALTINGLNYNLLDVYLGAPRVMSKTVLQIPILTELDDGTEKVVTRIEINLLPDGCTTSCPHTNISIGGGQMLSKFLDENPLRLLRQDGAVIFGNYKYFSPATVNIKIPKSLISTWDWGATKIQRESMGKNRDLDTVQGFTLQRIFSNYQIIFNDDGSGEIADLIGINDKDGIIEIDLFHCKYCSSKDGIATPGGRVTDCYEVSGQTSRSVKWVNSATALLSRIIARYGASKEKGFDRILKGGIAEIDLLRQKSVDREMKLGFYIVQPAISKKIVSDEQLTVLGTSYAYIKGVSGIDLKVITSE